MKKFRAEFQVRGYELDGYGHVNHAVYFNYAEFARWRMIEESGAGGDYFKKQGLTPVIVHAEADYRDQLFLADWVLVETELIQFRSRAANFKQSIYRKSTGALCAVIEVQLCGIRENKIALLPDDFEEYFGGIKDRGHAE